MEAIANQEQAPPEAPLAIDHRARMAVLGAVMLTMFLSALDQTVVGTALPRIVTDLNGSELYVWVVTAYLLTSTITIPVYGKFSDVYGRKVMLLIGVCLFLVGSWMSGFSQTMGQLIAFRSIQGLGAGAIMPVAMAVIGDLFTPRERGRYQGLFGAVFGLSFLVGPFIGGWITDNINWHWVFYVNVPFGIAALVALVTLLPNVRRERASVRTLDYPGIVVFMAAVVPLLVGLTNKGTLNTATGQLYNWTDPGVGGLILIGLVLLPVFVFVESRAREAIIPLDLFANRDYSISMAAVFLFGVAMFTAVIFMPRFYQTVRGISATASGYYIWPILVGLMGGSIGAGQIISRTGRYKWLMSSSAVALLIGAFLLTHLVATTPDWTLWFWLLILGLGIGPSMAGFTVIVQSFVPLSRMGVATSTLTFLRQIGATIGLAIAGTVFSSYFQSKLPDTLAQHSVPEPVIAQLLKVSGALQGVGNGHGLLAKMLPAQLQALIPNIIAGVNQAFAVSVGYLFWITLFAGGLAVLGTLGLHDLELRHGHKAEPDALTGVAPSETRA
ncbi:MAG TPA: MDR family MFS transporter [Candidatus Acidoferrales bacterium]|nr:MDR family MFS transporter [Candidatus Acidoferrales bacterium]